MAINMTISRSKRILASLKGYRIATPYDAQRIELMHTLEPAEELIGIYDNPPGTVLAEIVVTTERLILPAAHEQTQSIRYRDIKSVSAGEEGTGSRTICVSRHDGTTCNLEVSGGEGRFRDSMAFIQFLDRVVADLQRIG